MDFTYWLYALNMFMVIKLSLGLDKDMSCAGWYSSDCFYSMVSFCDLSSSVFNNFFKQHLNHKVDPNNW